ncbi:hypothetical protein O4328_31395 [Rhodococcus opacus]|uniref:Uncharacterized protein n=2 Tax=Rhodococcus TaxID=1827 RepID=A0ABT4NL73_RHOOP|nr:MULTISPECIES: hypothetical protein [Rhodococcus]MCZ4588139.1 hypothetical protein [Rhodococcus opacus]
MERFDIPADRAFEMLAGLSPDTNTPWAAVATRIVEAGPDRRASHTSASTHRGQGQHQSALVVARGRWHHRVMRRLRWPAAPATGGVRVHGPAVLAAQHNLTIHLVEILPSPTVWRCD